MYQIIKNVLSRGGYNLSAVLSKIDTVWAEGKLSDEQRDELIGLARKGANAEKDIDLMAKITELEERIRALEGTVSGEDFQEYAPGKWYYGGDTCHFEDANYICTAPVGTPCVWSPAEYPSYWDKI